MACVDVCDTHMSRDSVLVIAPATCLQACAWALCRQDYTAYGDSRELGLLYTLLFFDGKMPATTATTPTVRMHACMRPPCNVARKELWAFGQLATLPHMRKLATCAVLYRAWIPAACMHAELNGWSQRPGDARLLRASQAWVGWDACMERHVQWQVRRKGAARQGGSTEAPRPVRVHCTSVLQLTCCSRGRTAWALKNGHTACTRT